MPKTARITGKAAGRVGSCGPSPVIGVFGEASWPAAGRLVTFGLKSNRQKGVRLRVSVHL